MFATTSSPSTAVAGISTAWRRGAQPWRPAQPGSRWRTMLRQSAQAEASRATPLFPRKGATV